MGPKYSNTGLRFWRARVAEHFLIRLELKTPVILSHQTTLDALLAGLKFHETGNLDEALNDLPLRREHGLWCGSSVFLQAPVLTDELVLGSSVRHATLDPHLIRTKKNGRYITVDPKGGDFRNRQSSVRTYSSPAAYFMGEGNLAEVRRLMMTMTGMGKKRGAGYGQIDLLRSEFVDLEYPRQQGALMLSDGTPSRPIPVRTWESLNSLAPVWRAVVRYEPPYNLTEPAECVLPTHQHIEADRVNSLLM